MSEGRESLERVFVREGVVGGSRRVGEREALVGAERETRGAMALQQCGFAGLWYGLHPYCPTQEMLLEIGRDDGGWRQPYRSWHYECQHC